MIAHHDEVGAVRGKGAPNATMRRRGLFVLRAAARSDAVKRATRQAVAATRSAIERGFAAPTAHQARVMGIESVVEGVQWNLSTEQLKVLALARSGALRGKRRFCPDVLSRNLPIVKSPAAVAVSVAAKNATTKRRESDGKVEGGRATCTRSTPRTGHDVEATNLHLLGRAPRSYKPSRKNKKCLCTSHDGHSNSPSGPTARDNTETRQSRVRKTREQAVALARGGVWHGRMVFHRKGVKLTEDSPRSMLPRDPVVNTPVTSILKRLHFFTQYLNQAFQEEGRHPLCATMIALGEVSGEASAGYVTTLAAIVRAEALPAPMANDSRDTSASPSGGEGALHADDTRRCATSKILMYEQSFSEKPACTGLRLEVRRLDVSRSRAERRTTTGGIDASALTDSAPVDTFDDVKGWPADLCDNNSSSAHRRDTTTVDPMEQLRKPPRQRAVLDENDADILEANPPHGVLGGGGSTAADAGKSHLSRLANDETLYPTGATTVLLGSADDAVPGEPRHAADVVGGHHREGGVVVLVETLSHTEVDALLGPALSWTNPFEEDRTIRKLETHWKICLDSLCRRLCITHAVCLEVEVDAPSLTAEVGSRHHQIGHAGNATNDEEKRATEKTENPESLPGLFSGVASSVKSHRRLESNALFVSTNSDDGGRSFHISAVAAATETAAAETAETIETEAAASSPPPAPAPAPAAIAAGVVAEEFVGRLFSEVKPPIAAGDATAARAPDALCRRHLADVPGPPSAAVHERGTAEARVWLDRALMKVAARVPWGRRHRGRFAKVLFTMRLGRGCRGLEFVGVSASPTSDRAVRGRWECRSTDRDLARCLSTGFGVVAGAHPRARSYDPQRCAAELQERGELEWACTLLAKKAFRLALTVPGGVVLSLAGVAGPVGREVAWPQDIEEDRALARAAVEVQRAWRGWASRKHTRWVRMEREGRQRLSRLREEVEAERERVRKLELAEKEAREERWTRAQVVLASAARRQAARRERATRSRARDAEEKKKTPKLLPPLQLDDPSPSVTQLGTRGKTAATPEYVVEPTEMPTLNGGSCAVQEDGGVVQNGEVNDTIADETALSSTVPPGVLRLAKAVVIDGTEVHLTADVKGVDGSSSGTPLEMLLVAVDKKARRSSRLSLEAADIWSIVSDEGKAHGGDQGDNGKGGGGNGTSLGAWEVISAVLKRLTVFNSRRKGLFILSYKGKQVVAPH